MKKIAKITLPSLAEIAEIEKALAANPSVVSDFAIANGARTSVVTKNGKSHHTGEIWTRTLSDQKFNRILTYDLANQESNQKTAETNDVCVMPRFQNPAALGVGLAEWHGQSVLTFNNQIVAYPNKQMNDQQQVRALDTDFWQQSDGRAYHNPNNSLMQNRLRQGQIFENKQPTDANAQTLKVVTMNGESYAHVGMALPQKQYTLFSHGRSYCIPDNDYWFLYQPVRAMRCKDGSIQCLDQLAPCRFEFLEKFNAELPSFGSYCWQIGANGNVRELNTDAFEMGKSLRMIFDDLQRSTKFTNFLATKKLSQLATFDKAGLKLRQNTNDLGCSK